MYIYTLDVWLPKYICILTATDTPAPKDIKDHFLKKEDIFEHWTEYCDVKRISANLLQLNVISQDEHTQISRSNSKEANTVLYGLFENDPNRKKLELLADALCKDSSHQNNIKLADHIKDFLDYYGICLMYYILYIPFIYPIYSRYAKGRIPRGRGYNDL